MTAIKEEGWDVSETSRLRLHIHPGTSGLAPHMVLLAAGATFEVRTIDLFAGEGRTPAFQQLNPFGTVPVLEDGETVVPETGAILLHVAERFPDAGLLPRGGPDRAQALRWLFHAAALHADFMTWRRASMALRKDRHAMEATQAWMAKRLAEAFRTVERVVDGPFLVGPRRVRRTSTCSWLRGGGGSDSTLPRRPHALPLICRT